MVKRLLVAVTIFLLLLSLSFSSYAHSGRTDSSGGHKDSLTGEYHYHCGGHPAHDHPLGICPYDNKSNDKDNSDIFGIVAAAIVGVVIIFMVVSMIRAHIEEKRASIHTKHPTSVNTIPTNTDKTSIIISNCSAFIKAHATANDVTPNYQDELLSLIKNKLKRNKELLNAKDTERLSLSLICAEIPKLILLKVNDVDYDKEIINELYRMYKTLLSLAVTKSYIDESKKQELLQTISKMI